MRAEMFVSCGGVILDSDAGVVVDIRLVNRSYI